MKNSKKILILLFSIIVFLSSCYYDNYEELYPAPLGSNGCDTSGTVSYSNNISKIFSNNCTGCHSETTASGNIILDNYDGVVNAVNSGKLIPAIDQTGPFPMPPGGIKLSECEINQIKKWISQGNPNN